MSSSNDAVAATVIVLLVAQAMGRHVKSEIIIIRLINCENIILKLSILVVEIVVDVRLVITEWVADDKTINLKV
jgi:hypothetical protein